MGGKFVFVVVVVVCCVWRMVCDVSVHQHGELGSKGTVFPTVHFLIAHINTRVSMDVWMANHGIRLPTSDELCVVIINAHGQVGSHTPV